MARRSASIQAARQPNAEESAVSALERRREKVAGRIGKLERQVQKLGKRVSLDGDWLAPEERERLKGELSRLVARLRDAAERRLEEIAARL